MSTRSGKRIHKSFEEIAEINVIPSTNMSDRKTRSKKQKEKENHNVNQNKIRENYVLRYPSEDEAGIDEKPSRSVRKTTKNEILKENVLRETRSRKLIDDIVTGSGEKKRKGKKKHRTLEEPIHSIGTVIKQKNKKKKKSLIVEESNIKDQSNTSVNSYSTALGSPLETHMSPETKFPRKQSAEHNKIPNKNDSDSDGNPISNHITPISNKKTPSTIQKTPISNSETPISISNQKTSIFKQNSLISNQEISSSRVNENAQVMGTQVSKENSNGCNNITSPKESPPQNKRTSNRKRKILETLELPISKSHYSLTPEQNRQSVPRTQNSDQKPNIDAKTFDNTIDTNFDADSSSILFYNSDKQSSYNSENMINISPLLIESSDSVEVITPEKSLLNGDIVSKRQGTFTKESPPKLQREATFTKEKTPPNKCLPTAGHTPYHSNKKSNVTIDKSLNLTHSIEKSLLNITRSVEKPLNRTHSIEKSTHPSCAEKQTRVMFCSPVDNPLSFHRKSRVIKSSMKGSSKTFFYEDNPSVSRPSRKRSLTNGVAESAKRVRLNPELASSVDRLSRPRAKSATAKPTQEFTPVTKSTPNKPERSIRSKLPNFAALHQKQFARMESLDECQDRKAKRARHLLSPTGSLAVLEKRKSKDLPVKTPRRADPPATAPLPNKTPTAPAQISSTTQKPITTAPKPAPPKSTLESLIPRYSKFNFNANYHVNPFSVPRNHVITLKREKSQPSIKGSTIIQQKTGLKELVLKDRSIANKRNEFRNIIKGVRTNRRFELQMKSRNVNI